MPDSPDKQNRLPTIGITMGDPVGIGAEVIVKALADDSLRERANYVIYGMYDPIVFAADDCEIRPYWLRYPHDDTPREFSGVIISDFDEFSLDRRLENKPTAPGGRMSMSFLDGAIAAARTGDIDAIVTGPINKTAWELAGYPYTGHTSLLAERFKSRRVTMMFTGGPIRVALASIHIGLFELRNSFTIGLVFQPIDLLHQALRDWFGIENPRIAVAALNPHAGEHGRFGDEEHRIIEPAIEMARNAEIDATGPYPADTLFWRAAQGEFDGVVAMYHDQGLIPIKLLAFDRSVNVTLGLPIIRTSVDHGTGYDIAGKNQADPGSMKAAIKLAVDLSAQRLTNHTPLSAGEPTPQPPSE